MLRKAFGLRFLTLSTCDHISCCKYTFICRHLLPNSMTNKPLQDLAPPPNDSSQALCQLWSKIVSTGQGAQCHWLLVWLCLSRGEKVKTVWWLPAPGEIRVMRAPAPATWSSSSSSSSSSPAASGRRTAVITRTRGLGGMFLEGHQTVKLSMDPQHPFQLWVSSTMTTTVLNSQIQRWPQNLMTM